MRGNEIGMVFQDPMTSLNPTMTIGRQIAEAVLIHRDVSKDQAMSARSRCSTWSACRGPRSGCATTPTSSRAACASG